VKKPGHGIAAKKVSVVCLVIIARAGDGRHIGGIANQVERCAHLASPPASIAKQRKIAAKKARRHQKSIAALKHL